MKYQKPLVSNYSDYLKNAHLAVIEHGQIEWLNQHQTLAR